MRKNADHPPRIAFEAVRKRCGALPEKAGFADKCARYPSALSGGQQQRVVSARVAQARWCTSGMP